MNCPSRTDDALLLHPGWNQNPPILAADLTTCQDMNGIANARESGEADRLCNESRSMRCCYPEESDQEKESQTWFMGEGVKRYPKSALET